MTSISAHVAKDRVCQRPDCDGWEGHVTYTLTGSKPNAHRLPVIECCAALDAFTQRGEHEPCPLTQGDMAEGYREQENLVDPDA